VWKNQYLPANFGGYISVCVCALSIIEKNLRERGVLSMFKKSKDLYSIILTKVVYGDNNQIVSAPGGFWGTGRLMIISGSF
jgi:hypothetical protein